MRLICPNCGAQYEVPVEVVPEGGRDVQCSNCGHTWFQRHPDDDPDLAEELNLPVPDQSWQPEDEEDGPEPDPEVVPPAPPLDPPRRQIDPEMAALFAEERDLEIKRRQAEALESQPDLGLEEPDEDEHARRARESRERMARLRGEDPASETTRRATPRPAPIVAPPEEDEDDEQARHVAETAAAAAAAGSRRDLLPNVDEINQTLRAESDPHTQDDKDAYPEDTAAAQRSGFRQGFFLVVLLAAAAIAVYAYAPQLTQMVPQLGPVLDGYVAQVNEGRFWLDGQVTELLRSLDSMSSEAASDS
ncbi:zinc-ribbon domain-containing protein [Tropicibacter naphthalenivorans]|nr:zinc-ribbon domain-containing protein [Tropicibacter naphthalenivorans]